MSGYLIVFVDETGPVGSEHVPETWLLPLNRLQAQLEDERNLQILSVEWAPEPSKYASDGGPVLLVRVPGTHEIATAVSRPRRQRATRAYDDVVASRHEGAAPARYDRWQLCADLRAKKE